MTTKKNTDLEQIGSPLLAKNIAGAAFDAAMEADNKTRSEFIIDQLRRDMEALRKVKSAIATMEQAVTFYTARIAAARDGAFIIGPNDLIKFNDPELNKRSIENSDGSAHFL